MYDFVTDAKLIILAGNLFDGVESALKPDAAIFVRDGLIQDIILGFGINSLPLESSAKIINLSEYTILPGLIDCHVHLALNGVDFKGSTERWNSSEAVHLQTVAELTQSAKHGLSLIRDGGDREGIGLRARDLQGTGVGPAVLACGKAISKQGCYGAFLGSGAADLNEALLMIDELSASGVDWIKLLLSGIVSFNNYGFVGKIQFSSSEASALVERAHSHGLQVMAHASSDEAVRIAIESGTDSIEHGYFLSTESLKAMAERGIPWVPTVVPVANQLLDANGRYSEQELEVIRRTFQLQLERLAEAATMGVILGIGTDAGASGVRHGIDYFQELRLFAKAGLSNYAVLRAATLDGARICGKSAQGYGVLQRGSKAALFAVEGNPLENLGALENINFYLAPIQTF